MPRPPEGPHGAAETGEGGYPHTSGEGTRDPKDGALPPGRRVAAEVAEVHSLHNTGYSSVAG